MCSQDDETEQETLTDDEVKELYGFHPFLLLASRGGPKHKGKNRRNRYSLKVIQKPFEKIGSKKKKVHPLRKRKLERLKREKDKLLETYKDFTWFGKKRGRKKQI